MRCLLGAWSTKIKSDDFARNEIIRRTLCFKRQIFSERSRTLVERILQPRSNYVTVVKADDASMKCWTHAEERPSPDSALPSQMFTNSRATWSDMLVRSVSYRSAKTNDANFGRQYLSRFDIARTTSHVSQKRSARIERAWLSRALVSRWKHTFTHQASLSISEK